VFQLSNEQTMALALELLAADSEAAVISILRSAGFWDAPTCWRLLGDNENNFSTVGGQQARPEPALVEKIVNSIDARLMGACLRAGINPESAAAPQSIQEARERFFAGMNKTDLARAITLAVTGARAQSEGMPCITICDIGEGQTPRAVPDTFMSLDKKNKLRIPFVQGKFNMGGTGALQFCGHQKTQLLITKRDPTVLATSATHQATDGNWSFTVVRRETPPGGPGQVRNPYYRYLAPVGADVAPNRGDVMSFKASELKLMPEDRRPYVRPMEWGSCVKLYDYDMRGFKSYALRKGGLLPRLEVLLPEVAHPVRIHECREGFRGHAGSFDTNLLGLRERLGQDRGGANTALEPGYPTSLTMRVQGQPFVASVYAFKKDTADTYLVDQGVIFTLNGQNHGGFPRSFFARQKVKMQRLAKSLLVVVDCTDISVEARADLFKNSRDRLSRGELSRDIEEELESQIANHAGLRDLRERRRQEEVAERLDDMRPLEDVLKEILRSSPSLSRLFMRGQRLNTPYRAGHNGGGNGHGGGTDGTGGKFVGRKHPSFFRFERLKDGEALVRSSEHGRRCRVRFATDVENEYFLRDSNRGRYHVDVIDGCLNGRELTTSINLFNGVANWSVTIPGEDTAPGDSLTLQFTVEDDVLLEPFANVAKISLTPKSDRDGGSNGERRERTGGDSKGSQGTGSGNESGRDGAEQPSGIELPPIKKVKQEGWAQFGFDDKSACTVIEEPTGEGTDERLIHSFYINVDNIFLQTDIKNGDGEPALVEAKYVYGNVLVGLALIHDRTNRRSAGTSSDSPDSEEEPVSKNIEQVTRALAPFLVPMVDYLGRLEPEDVAQLAQVGDEE
jgi:hypothetical protein